MANRQRLLAFLVLAAMCVSSAVAQTTRLQRKARAAAFKDGKPLLGLPSEPVVNYARCSADGLSYVTPRGGHDGTPQPADLYSVSVDAEVKHFLRKLPIDYNVITVSDFFASTHTLVTLLKAEKTTDDGTRTSTRDTTYFLSVSDHEGASADLVALNLKFTPFKIAILPSGQFLVLGWEPANELPVLALLKADGTVRSFLDLDDRNAYEPRQRRFSQMLMDAAAKHTSAGARGALERAAFAAWGGRVLLTFPFTTLPINILSDAGVSRPVPLLNFPSGYVLHDIVDSSDSNTWVVRARQQPGSEDPTQEVKVEDRLFEFSSQNGNFLRDIVTTGAPIAQVTCAAYYKLTAIFQQPIAGGSPVTSTRTDGTKEETTPQQWVVSTIR